MIVQWENWHNWHNWHNWQRYLAPIVQKPVQWENWHNWHNWQRYLVRIVQKHTWHTLWYDRDRTVYVPRGVAICIGAARRVRSRAGPTQARVDTIDRILWQNWQNWQCYFTPPMRTKHTTTRVARYGDPQPYQTLNFANVFAPWGWKNTVNCVNCVNCVNSPIVHTLTDLTELTELTVSFYPPNVQKHFHLVCQFLYLIVNLCVILYIPLSFVILLCVNLTRALRRCCHLWQLGWWHLCQFVVNSLSIRCQLLSIDNDPPPLTRTGLSDYVYNYVCMWATLSPANTTLYHVQNNALYAKYNIWYTIVSYVTKYPPSREVQSHTYSWLQWGLYCRTQPSMLFLLLSISRRTIAYVAIYAIEPYGERAAWNSVYPRNRIYAYICRIFSTPSRISQLCTSVKPSGMAYSRVIEWRHSVVRGE